VLNVTKHTIKHVLTSLILALSFAAAPVAAGPSEDAAAAISRGDYTTALRLWRALATQGDVKAQMWLGQIYDYGLSDKIPQDYAEAVKWYRLAANQDDPDRQFFLGEMYFMGQGVTRDLIQAYMWFDLAAAKGDRLKAELRDDFAKALTQEQIAEAQKLSREWKPTAQPYR
jgi:uncharacterized protein